jgi:hypothetical protein
VLPGILVPTLSLGRGGKHADEQIGQQELELSSSNQERGWHDANEEAHGRVFRCQPQLDLS